jgi:hypothetical protein
MKLSCLALGVMAVSSAHAEPFLMRPSAPTPLTESQLDTVTAGSAGVSVDAAAVLYGSSGYASTQTYTTAYGSSKFSGATGTGQAYACCGAAATSVTTSAYATGRNTSTLQIGISSTMGGSSYSTGYVNAWSRY